MFPRTTSSFTSTSQALLSIIRWPLLACILSLSFASAQDSAISEKATAPQDKQQIAPTTKSEDAEVPTKKTAKDREDANKNNPNAFLNVNPDTNDERELHDSLITKVRSLNGGREKRDAEPEANAKNDDGESIMEDFKMPLIIIGSLLVYFIPTLLGMRRNDFKKVFFINLLLGCTVVARLIAMHFKPFPMHWLYICAGVSLALALVPLFLKDCAPPPEPEGRRRQRSRRRSHS